MFPTQSLSAAKWGIELMRPSILTNTGGSGHQRLQTARNTAYLDGLRGFAAFMVYWQHYQLWPRPSDAPNKIMENVYGYEGEYHFVTLPGIRTFFTGGHFAVAVFFVISGYVLSTKPLSLIYDGEYSNLGENLASALFRRWIRLFVPVIVISFLYMCSWHAFGGIWTSRPDHQSNFKDEFWMWYVEFKNFSFVFRTDDPGFRYNFPTWSIPVEFRGSIIIYTALLAFSRSTRNARLLGQVGLIYYFLYIVDGWYGAMFTSGMLLSELDHLTRTNNLPFPNLITKLTPYKPAIFNTLFIISIYLSGVPSHCWDIETLWASPGWWYLSYLKPSAVRDYKWYYLFWAAILLVLSIPRLPWLKSFFENRFNQYLGRISFALYLVHGPVLWILGDRLYVAVGWYHGGHEAHIPEWINRFPVSSRGPLGLELCFWVPQVVLLPLTLWVAEVVERVVDEPCVRFSRWVYRLSLAPSPGLG